MIKLVTVAHIIALARNRVPILINIASRKPIFQEEFLGFEGQFHADIRAVIFTQAKIYKEVCWTPDASAPIIIVKESGVIPWSDRNHPLPPELIVVQKVLFNHPLRLGWSGGLGNKWIEIGDVNSLDRFTCPEIPAIEHSVLIVPEHLKCSPDTSASGENLFCLLPASQLRGNLGKILTVHHIQGVKAHVIVI